MGHSFRKKITNKLPAIMAAAKAIARPARTVCDLSLLSYTLGLTRRAAALLRVRPLLDSISRRLILHSFTMILPALLKGHEPPNKKKKKKNRKHHGTSRRGFQDYFVSRQHTRCLSWLRRGNNNETVRVVSPVACPSLMPCN